MRHRRFYSGTAVLTLLLLGACATEKPEQVIYKMDRVTLRLEEFEGSYKQSYSDQGAKLDEMARRLATESEAADVRSRDQQRDISQIQAELEWLESLYAGDDAGGEFEATGEHGAPGSAAPTPAPESETLEGLPELLIIPTPTPFAIEVATPAPTEREAPTAPESPTEPEAPAVREAPAARMVPGGSLNEREAWREAERIHTTHGCNGSRDVFARFILDFPRTPRTPLARLRLAECNMAVDEYAAALIHLNEAASGELDLISGPPILLKIAECHVALQRTADAEAAYRNVVMRYPESIEARTAGSWLKQYGSTPE